MPKITTNYIYNVVLTLSTFIINLLLFPYISRVLGVDYVGRIGFVNNVVNYFSLFVLLGIRTVGIREIAGCGNNREERSKVFSSLTSYILISSAVICLIYFSSIFTIPRFKQELPLFIIGGVNLFFNSFLIEWFYQGLEDFKYITIRNVLIKVIYAVSVLFLIKSKDDFILYAAITTAVILINAVINITYSKKYVDFSFNHINFKKFIRPILSLGVYNIMVSMYTTFNVIYLGFVCSDNEVGYYYTATKIYYIIIGFFTAFTNVMLPRMSSLLASNNKAEFINKLNESFDLIVSIAMPIVAFFCIMAPETIRLISGIGFEGAITPMRIIMPVLLITSCAQVWVIQLLMPLKKDNIILIGSIVGAFVGIVLNIIFVKELGAIGSSIVMLFSELSGGLYSLIYTLRKKLLSIPIYGVFIHALATIPVVIVTLFVKSLIEADIVCFLIVFIFFTIYYLSYFMINKKSFVGKYIRCQIISSFLK